MVRERTLATEKYSEASELRVVEIRVSRHGVGELLARVEHMSHVTELPLPLNYNDHNSKDVSVYLPGSR